MQHYNACSILATPQRYWFQQNRILYCTQMCHIKYILYDIGNTQVNKIY